RRRRRSGQSVGQCPEHLEPPGTLRPRTALDDRSPQRPLGRRSAARRSSRRPRNRAPLTLKSRIRVTPSPWRAGVNLSASHDALTSRGLDGGITTIIGGDTNDRAPNSAHAAARNDRAATVVDESLTLALDGKEPLAEPTTVRQHRRRRFYPCTFFSRI